MALKYYSDRTNKFYNSAEEANRAEFELKEKENLEKIKKEREVARVKEEKEKALAERKEAAEKVTKARQAFNDARKAYADELNAFCKKYGTYHYSTTSEEEVPSLFDILDKIFKF